MDIRKLQKIVVNALEDIKGKDIEVINTTKLTSLFDRLVIATGDSNRQVKALARNVQINHAELGSFIHPYNPVVAQAYPSALTGNATTLQMLDGLVNVQAAMISYVDDFYLMMWVTLLAMPLALILRRPARA